MTLEPFTGTLNAENLLHLWRRLMRHLRVPRLPPLILLEALRALLPLLRVWGLGFRVQGRLYYKVKAVKGLGFRD